MGEEMESKGAMDAPGYEYRWEMGSIGREINRWARGDRA
jgi:hypothetical protein